MDGNTPLHIAANHGSTEVIAFFLEKLALDREEELALVMLKNNDNKSAFYLSVKFGFQLSIKCFFKYPKKCYQDDEAGFFRNWNYTNKNSRADVFYRELYRKIFSCLNTDEY